MWLWKFHIPAAGRLSFANRCLVLHHPHPRWLFSYQWLFKSRPVIPFLVCCDSVIVGSVKFVLLKSYESFSSHLQYHNFREKHNSTKWLEDNFPKLGLATFPGTICWLGGMFFFIFRNCETDWYPTYGLTSITIAGWYAIIPPDPSKSDVQSIHTV